jgi:hypothetical protein
LRQAQKQQQSKFLVHKFIFTAQFRPIPSTELSTDMTAWSFPWRHRYNMLRGGKSDAQEIGPQAQPWPR